MRALAVSLIATVFSVTVFAGDCSSIDLRPELGPPRDQGDTSWCYAHTSADLISQVLKKRVSSFDLAAQYMLGDLEALKNHPSPEIQKYLKDHPKTIPEIIDGRESDPKVLKPNVIVTEDGIYSAGGNEDGAILMSNLKGLCADEDLTDGAETYVRHLQNLQKYRTLERLGRCEGERPPTRAPFKNVEDVANRVAMDDVSAWVDEQCKQRIKTDKPLVPKLLLMADSKEEFEEKVRTGKINRAAAQKKLFAEIDAALERGRVSAIGFSAYDLQNPDIRTRRTSTGTTRPSSPREK